MNRPVIDERIPGGEAGFWQRRVDRFRLRVNFAWWLECFLPALFLAASVATILVLSGRHAQWDRTLLSWVSAACIAVAAVFAWRRARAHFIDPTQARAALDYALQTHSRLSSASDGVGSFPSHECDRSGLWRWRWQRLLFLPACAALLLLAAWWVPVAPAQIVVPPPTAKAPALTEVEEWIEALKSNPAVEEESIEPLEEQAEQLAAQRPEDWYSHGSLEAADHLRAKLAGGMEAFAQASTEMEGLLGALQKEGAALSEMQAADWRDKLGAALGGLEGNMPGLRKDLAERLREIDPSRLRSLSPEDLAKLRDKLKEGSSACKACLAKGETLAEGEGEGERPGVGGVSRGPGTAPLTFRKDETDLKSTALEGLENSDLENAALGELAGLSSGRPEADTTAGGGVQDGGAVSAEGKGAGAVWLPSHLAPAERQRLRDFFK